MVYQWSLAKKLKRDVPNVQKQAEAKKDGVIKIKPTKLQF